jgi:hypothetical protein
MTTPKAFVIMPFAEGFDVIYSLFIQPTLAEAGYEVRRADEIRSAQNILKDIILGLVNSDLVVADLTDSNPNVYYELGLAHALGRPVIMLSQEMEELPFDLRSYRVIPYKTHFADIQQARAELLQLAKGCLDSSVPFGSPVGDFLPDLSSRLPVQSTQQDVELGQLDYLANLEEGLEQLTAIVSENNVDMSNITNSAASVTNRINVLRASPNTSSAREARNLIAALAMELSSYSDSLSVRNDKYSRVLLQTGTALEWFARSQDPRTNEEKKKLSEYRTELQSLQDETQSSRNAVNDLIVTFRNIPPLERSFERAKTKAVRELERYGDNFDQTISIVGRTKEILDSRLLSGSQTVSGS